MDAPCAQANARFSLCDQAGKTTPNGMSSCLYKNQYCVLGAYGDKEPQRTPTLISTFSGTCHRGNAQMPKAPLWSVPHTHREKDYRLQHREGPMARTAAEITLRHGSAPSISRRTIAATASTSARATSKLRGHHDRLVRCGGPECIKSLLWHSRGRNNEGQA